MRFQIRLGLLLAYQPRLQVESSYAFRRRPRRAVAGSGASGLLTPRARSRSKIIRNIRAAQLAAAAANDVTTETRSAYYPNLYGSLTGVEADSGSRIAAGGLNNSIIFNRFATGVAAEQLVTDFGRTKNLVASSRLQAQAANETVNVSRADVLLNVDRAFYDTLSGAGRSHRC